jgi:hypothetical protein
MGMQAKLGKIVTKNGLSHAIKHGYLKSDKSSGKKLVMRGKVHSWPLLSLSDHA